MNSRQDPERFIAMERTLHQYVLGPWSADHAGRPGSVITQLDYDRERYPEQRLDTFKTKIDRLPAYFLPSRLLPGIIEGKLAKAFKSPATAQLMIDSFKDRPASKSDETPLLAKLAGLLDNRETVSLVDTHADFTGGVKLMAALSAALGERRYLRRNHAIISNTMTREAIYGRRAAELAKPITNVVWVNPDTENYDRLLAGQDLDEETAELVKTAGAFANAGAMRALKTARKQGGILQWAPFSSAVIRELDPDSGQLAGLKTPALPAQVPGLLARSRYALPAGYWEDPDSGEVRWAIGSLIDRDTIDVEPRRVRDGVYLERTIGELCIILNELSGVPVNYSGKIFEASPHRIVTAQPGTGLTPTP